ncbi:MAG: universal stress protein [Flavobacteriaceae bacterium]
MQKILFPTDFSENSWNAIQYAFAFFKGKSLEFHFLHIGFKGMVEEDADLHALGLSVASLSSEESVPL